MCVVLEDLRFANVFSPSLIVDSFRYIMKRVFLALKFTAQLIAFVHLSSKPKYF